MSVAIQRAQILVQQNRHQDAVEELVKALPADPENVLIHYILADCYSNLDKHGEARSHAERAIALAPEWSHGHHMLALVMLRQDQAKKALAHVQEAVRLDPEVAEFRGLEGMIHVQLHKGQQALDAADRGLSLDPENVLCMNVRAMALRLLGRVVPSSETLRQSLAREPGQASTHANLGWSLLHEGDPTGAGRHFKEALRLDPEDDWARQGLVESLKARHRIYALMLRYFLWMGRFSPRTRVIMVVGLMLGMRVVVRIGQATPGLEGVAGAAAAAYAGFVLLTWVSTPFFNLLLLAHPEGRYALSDRQRAGAYIFGLGLLAATGVVVTGLVLRVSETPATQLLAVFLLLLPLSLVVGLEEVRLRVIGWVSGLCIAVAVVAGVLAALGFSALMAAFVVLCILSTWLVFFVRRR